MQFNIVPGSFSTPRTLSSSTRRWELLGSWFLCAGATWTGTLPPDKRLVLQACGDSQAIMAGTCSGIGQAFTCLNRVFQAHF